MVSKRARHRPSRATPIAEIEAARGRQELLYVDLDDDLVVGVRLRNLESLLALGLIPDPLMNAAMRFGKRVEAGDSVDGVLEGIGVQDIICANTIEEPPYADLEEVRANGGMSVAGKLDLSLLTSGQIRSLIMLVMHGLDTWESFRDEQRRARAGLERANMAADAERVLEDAALEAPDAAAADGSPVGDAGQGVDDPSSGPGEPLEFVVGQRRLNAV